MLKNSWNKYFIKHQEQQIVKFELKKSRLKANIETSPNVDI